LSKASRAQGKKHMIPIETERLRLRMWQDNDADPYLRINQDPRVIEYLRGLMKAEQVQDFMRLANRHQQQLGYALWAAERKDTGALIGFIGLNKVDFASPFEAPFSPAIEVGWRLGCEHWGQGYATEGALACLKHGFHQAGLKQIVAFTVPTNRRSLRVMEKIGMKRDVEGDFAHPRLPQDHPLSLHVLYRKSADTKD
jgi:RimJ/RimL family protein N-acetyltransferase